MINRNTIYCKLVLFSFFLSGCGYTQLEKNPRHNLPIFMIESSVEFDEVLSSIEVFEDTNEVPHDYIVIGTNSIGELRIPFPFNKEQDQRLFDKLIQETSLSDADAITNLKYDFRTAIVFDAPGYELREVNALLIKYVEKIETTDRIFLRFDLKEPALITVILYDLKGNVVAKPFDSHKQYAEWGPLIYRKKDLPNGYYKLYTKGVHYYNDGVLWEKSKWIKINTN